jgi:hypothetical protein
MFVGQAVPPAANTMLPREHGAWAMLLLPYLCGLVLVGRWHWSVVPATAALLSVFLIRQPLVVLGRQHWVWTQTRPESAVAKRWLGALLLVLLLTATALAGRWGWPLLGLFAAGAFALTCLAVWMTLRNRQRSVWLQAISAAGLTASALAASVSATGELRPWSWWLWGLSAAHSTAAVLVVHHRLELRIALKSATAEAPRFRRAAFAAQFVLLAAGLVLLGAKPWLAPALMISALAHLWDLAAIRSAQGLQTPLRIVGLRALALHVVFSALVTVGLLCDGAP